MAGVTLLTGASSGLGAALAPLLAAEGRTVLLAARRLERLESLAATIGSAGGRAIPVQLDVTDRDAVATTLARVQDEHGAIECLIANAGVGDPTPAKRFSADTFELVVGTNLMGAVYCIEAVLPGMLERGSGQIVGVSSIASSRGLPFFGAYCASKAGLTALLESLRIELRRRGIYVTAVCPGFFSTEMTAESRVPMPFLMTAEATARRVHRAIRRKKRLYIFPWPLKVAAGLGRRLPAWLYDGVLSRMSVRRDPAKT